MKTRTLLIIGVSFLVISLVSAGLAIWQTGVRDQSSSTLVPWPNTEEFVTVDVAWPRSMHTNESAWVTVSLAPKTRLQIPDFVIVPGQERDDVVVTATLATTSFEIKNVQTEPQSVRGRSRIGWLWMITTKHPGHQALGVLLNIERRARGSTTLKERQSLFGSGTVVVVRDPLVSAQLEGLALIAGAVGMLLSLPLPVEAVIRRIEARSKGRSQPL